MKKDMFKNNKKQTNKTFLKFSITIKVVCLCRGFTAQSTQWGYVERGQFT